MAGAVGLAMTTEAAFAVGQTSGTSATATTTKGYAWAGVSTEAATGVVPTRSQTQAAVSVELAMGLRAGSLDASKASLVHVTHAQVADVSAPSTPSISRQLAWAMTVAGASPLIMSPGNMSAEQRTALQARTCNQTVFVSANDGSVIEELQDCPLN
jgi:cobalamin biosynthesis protein CbiD